MNHGRMNVMLKTLRDASDALEAGVRPDTIAVLVKFINEVQRWQNARQISNASANQMIRLAQGIIALL